VIGELFAGYVADGRLRLTALDLVADGLHEVSLAHANAAVEEQRVVGFGRTFGDGLASGVRELIARADDKSVESVARVELRSAIPVEARLRRRRGCSARGEAAIVADRGRRRIVLGRDKLHVVELEAQVVDGFLNEVGIFVAGVPELDGGHANEQNSAAGMTVACGFQPRVIGMPVNLFFQRVKNAHPRIWGESCAWN